MNQNHNAKPLHIAALGNCEIMTVCSLELPSLGVTRYTQYITKTVGKGCIPMQMPILGSNGVATLGPKAECSGAVPGGVCAEAHGGVAGMMVNFQLTVTT